MIPASAPSMVIGRWRLFTQSPLRCWRFAFIGLRPERLAGVWSIHRLLRRAFRLFLL